MNESRFPPVESGYPFPRLELEVLEHWRRERIFERTLERTADGPEFVFYEGPPTANNTPHVGHVVTRVVKDLVPRYRTMRGDFVARKGGWDTHGLPVEIEVEKRLGFTGKKQIEDYGIAEFNRRCLESVDVYEKQWREMVERVGHWIDLDHPYLTYTNDYIESVWWALATLANRGLLERGYKIQHYCGRCGTPLSSHEVAQNYKDVDDPSVWALFPLRDGQSVIDADGVSRPLDAGVKLVAWTTTPWTLLSHAGLAVNPKLSYRLVRHPARTDLLIFAEGLEQPVPFLTRGADGKTTKIDLRSGETVARFSGQSLLGLRYDRPLRVAPGSSDPDAGNDTASDALGWLVVAGDYVTATDGTGIVHTAPLFGEDDYRTGQTFKLPQLQAVDPAGLIRSGAGLDAWAGLWFKDADKTILAELERTGRLLHHERYRHSYAFCWRCDQPLLFYATDSWFIRTTLQKDRLIENNRRIDWHPPHVGEGRFGDWLENLVDWALSRNRYWGTPLPIWICDQCGHQQAIGSYAELFEAAGKPLPANVYDRGQFDPHRPYIDDFAWPCAKCNGGSMRRVEQVIDAWFDSGAMPFAQHHYPFENQELFRRRFPADFISEAVDQTRGWFFTLHAIATLLFDDLAFRHCIVLGHVNDESGRKMSKRIGNVVDPMAVIAESGADALRWYFCVNNPEQPARFSARLVRDAAQSFLLPLWNALSFFSIYANLDGWRPGRPEPAFAERPALDRWILLRLATMVRDSTAALDNYRITDASRAIAAFVDDLTNWYIRRSRDRFWAGSGAEHAADKESAYQALYEVLVTLARVLAPFTPFVADVLHRNLVRSLDAGAAASVHLEDWPAPVQGREEPALEQSMDVVQRIVRFGHAARNAHGLRTRQPLESVTVVASDRALAARVDPYLDLVRDELNVREVRFAERRAEYVHHDVLPVFPKLGPRFGKRMPAVKAALAAADGDQLAEQLEASGAVAIELDGERVTLAPEEVEVRLIERAGMAIQGDRELLVALDAELTPDLVNEGLAREVIHRIQRARKDRDLDYADRIRVRYRAGAELEQAIDRHRDWIAGETLAIELLAAENGSAGFEAGDVEGHKFELAIERCDVAGIFKAYDVRGVYPTEIDEAKAKAIGLAFPVVLDRSDLDAGKTIVVGRDMRPSSVPLERALVEGLLEAGLDVIRVGLVTTPMSYFAVGHLGAAGGVQVTASHNPPRYNGFKFSRRDARPVSGDRGIPELERRVEAGTLAGSGSPGRASETTVMPAYREHVLRFLRPAPAGAKRRKVVVDAANGMGCLYQPILEAAGVDLDLLYFELDGTFPNHEPNPLKLENLEALCRRVRETGADLGVAFDGDADRAAFVDERGEPVGSDIATALIGGELLDREPGKAVVYDLRSSRAVPEHIKAHGGVPVRERVGHSFIKATLREHHGIFGGELAGHYYFRDNYHADCSLAAVFEILNLLRSTGRRMSELTAPLLRYAKTPEINFEVEDKAGAIAELARRFADGQIDYLDGITVQYPTWWFNVRPSNTEPLLRLVAEADTPETLAEKKAILVAFLGEPV